MKQIFLSIFLVSNIAIAQSESNTTYYKDKYGRMQSDTGAYALEVSKTNDSVVTQIFFKVKNGQKIWTKSYLGEQPYGKWNRYDRKGNIESTLDYDFVVKYGELIPERAQLLEDLGITVMSDINTEKIQKHIRDKFKYPEVAQEENIQGKVIVQFTISSDGKVDNLRILEGVHSSLDTECYRIMNSLKELEPYTKDGEKVMVYRTIPITFKMV
ncbi:energy transducer TonB [Maribacter chungangensis]|uniref:Energy transducer TonB n=1 Tax=Maribacter chungangensis TaxID=1069117 RepID=A0ABW3B5Y9_9FLAO